MKPPLPRKRSKATRPWHFPDIEDDAEIYAIQALARGSANEYQQTLAWNFITKRLCETDRMPFWPGGEDGRRATDFAAGKQWVGLQLRKILNLKPKTVFGNSPPSQEIPPE